MHYTTLYSKQSPFSQLGTTYFDGASLEKLHFSLSIAVRNSRDTSGLWKPARCTIECNLFQKISFLNFHARNKTKDTAPPACQILDHQGNGIEFVLMLFKSHPICRPAFWKHGPPYCTLSRHDGDHFSKTLTLLRIHHTFVFVAKRQQWQRAWEQVSRAL